MDGLFFRGARPGDCFFFSSKRKRNCDININEKRFSSILHFVNVNVFEFN